MYTIFIPRYKQFSGITSTAAVYIFILVRWKWTQYTEYCVGISCVAHLASVGKKRVGTYHHHNGYQ